jgi:hypothetical protein
MNVSTDMYIVISLMFAVFAAVAAVGTSLVLGVGFERLRAGFDIVRKQTAYFSDAIHKLDQRTGILNERTEKMQDAVTGMTQKVERIEKQTDFFSDALHTLQRQVSEQPKPSSLPDKTLFAEPVLPSLPSIMMTPDIGEETVVLPTHTESVIQTLSALKDREKHTDRPAAPRAGLSDLLFSYLRSEPSAAPGRETLYH